MDSSRKYMRDVLYSANYLKERNDNLQKEFASVLGEEKFLDISRYYDLLIKGIQQKITAMPIGFRYTGVFYLKKSHVTEIEFERYDGVLFMREDLISWKIESGGTGNESFYLRSVYREPSLNSPLINKADKGVTPVFEHNKES